MKMLEIKDIKKMYTSDTGIKNISLSCDSGETIAFIGPNGVGKTTLLKIIYGVLKPDQGSVLLNKRNTSEYATREEIGYMPENINIGKKVSTKELLYLVSDYKYQGKYKDEIDESIHKYNLEKQCNEAFCKLSMGSKKKASMIIAFMGYPKLIILDEPTNGVDTAGIICLKQDIMEAKKRGSIVIVSSHILDFVSTVSDTNVFLKDGEIGKIVTGGENLEEIYSSIYVSP